MFISEVQNKNALQRALISRRAMTESAQWPVGAVIGRLLFICSRLSECPLDVR